jgi:hypothetical protein
LLSKEQRRVTRSNSRAFRWLQYRQRCGIAQEEILAAPFHFSPARRAEIRI